MVYHLGVIINLKNLGFTKNINDTVEICFKIADFLKYVSISNNFHLFFYIFSDEYSKDKNWDFWKNR